MAFSFKLNMSISPQMRRGGSGRLEENGSGRFGFRGGRDEDSGWGDEGGRRVNGRNNGRDDRGWGDDRRGNDDRRMPGDRDRLDRGGGGRDRDRDRNGRRRQNEPEWMNENISRSDVIELRGFENPSKGSKEQANGGIGKSVNLENSGSSLNSRKSNHKIAQSYLKLYGKKGFIYLLTHLYLFIDSYHVLIIDYIQ